MPDAVRCTGNATAGAAHTFDAHGMVVAGYGYGQHMDNHVWHATSDGLFPSMCGVLPAHRGLEAYPHFHGHVCCCSRHHRDLARQARVRRVLAEHEQSTRFMSCHCVRMQVD